MIYLIKNVSKCWQLCMNIYTIYNNKKYKLKKYKKYE